MSEKLRIAIDGPGGAGKSTIAKMIALELAIDYIDTGAMYRAVAYKMKEKGIGIADTEALAAMLGETDIDFSGGDIVLDGAVINEYIRTPEISKLASDCSAIGIVREKLVGLQKAMGVKKSVIMDGRDIGTNVMTGAEYKFYMTADPEERARRRHKELLEKGQSPDFARVLEDITSRDRNDMTRALNPLAKADDAIEIDTTFMSIRQVCEFILGKVKGETDGNN